MKVRTLWERWIVLPCTCGCRETRQEEIAPQEVVFYCTSCNELVNYQAYSRYLFPRTKIDVIKLKWYGLVGKIKRYKKMPPS